MDAKRPLGSEIDGISGSKRNVKSGMDSRALFEALQFPTLTAKRHLLIQNRVWARVFTASPLESSITF
eukprot:10203022-Heterocapsa_arctica.AAC.1